MDPIFISEREVSAVLQFDRLIPAMREALMGLSSGAAQQPVREVIQVAGRNAWFGIMPAVCGDVMGAKLVTFFPANAGTGLHTHQAMIQLFRAATGEPLAVMDGRVITEMRTAAVSAVALDLLAPRRPLVLAILGSGVQAHSHLEAFRIMREFSEVRVWSRTHAHAEAFSTATGARACESVEMAVAGADVTLTVTSAAEPVLLGKWLKRDSMVMAVGAVGPKRREVDDDAMKGHVVVESRAAAEVESGDLLLSGSVVYAEIGELLNGTKPIPCAPIVYKSLGAAVEDIAAAQLVYELTRMTSR